MKAYSEYQGSKRTCKNCLYFGSHKADDPVEIPDCIYCEKDDERILDISEDVDGSIAKGCPFWKNDEDDDLINRHIDPEIISDYLGIECEDGFCPIPSKNHE